MSPSWLRAGGGPGELVGYRLEVDWEGAGWLPAEQLSEGTLFALCLLVALEQSAGAGEVGLLLLDDIDRGLHPAAQPELLGVLRGVLEERPGLRVLATTHSPFFLDRLEAEEVGVLAFGGEGEVVLRPLSEHPDWPRNAFLSAGEFWTLAGESWAAERGEE